MKILKFIEAKIQEQREKRYHYINQFIDKSIKKEIQNFSNYHFFLQHQAGKHVGYFDIDLESKSPNSPRNPWAFIRVKDEEKTLKASLYSILGAIQRGIIAYHDITDGSEKIILEFCEKFPTFKAYYYPHQINLSHPVKKEEFLCNFYNFALSKIPKNEYLIKIDADHIYDAKKLYKSFYFIKNENHVLSIPRVDFIYTNKKKDGGGGILVRSDHFCLNNPIDHWLIFNDDLVFQPWIDPISKKTFEILRFKKPYIVYTTELNNWHFPFQKPHRRDCINSFQWVSLQKFKQKSHSLIDKKMLDLDYILSHLELMDKS